jgi:molybdopterin synthase catalytic subunit
VFVITGEAIDPAAFARERRGDGGVVTFLGVVRDRDDDGRPVAGLSYEAFEPMAIAAFESIAQEARERFGDVQTTIVHRIGEVSAGDVAVAVIAAAPHREAAFDACRYCIDELKRRAPIWKKERYADGQELWKANPGRG